MEFLLGLDRKTILSLPVAIMCFVCAWKWHKQKKEKVDEAYKKVSDGYRTQSFIDQENELKGNMPLKNDWEGQNLRDAEDIRSGMGLMLWVRYLDWIFLFSGIVLVANFYQKVSGDALVDAFMVWWLS